MKKILALLLSAIFLFTGCGSSAASGPVRPTAQDSLESLMKAIKEWDVEEIQKHDNGVLISESAKGIPDTFDYRLMVKNMSYEILSCEENGDEAIAKVRIKNTDMGAVMKDFASEAISLA
jgi:PBP1b-binding outer membrane lipoprotein LpoB